MWTILSFRCVWTCDLRPATLRPAITVDRAFLSSFHHNTHMFEPFLILYEFLFFLFHFLIINIALSLCYLVVTSRLTRSFVTSRDQVSSFKMAFSRVQIGTTHLSQYRIQLTVEISDSWSSDFRTPPGSGWASPGSQNFFFTFFGFSFFRYFSGYPKILRYREIFEYTMKRKPIGRENGNCRKTKINQSTQTANPKQPN